MVPSPDSESIDVETVRRVVEEHPVRAAVLYGSQVRGTAGVESDIDVAVAFEPGLSSAERLQARVALVVDLVEALGYDDVDVADLDGIRPAVGLSAIEHGEVLLGETVLEEYRDRFRGAVDLDGETHADRMRRFDEVIERLKNHL